MLGPSSPSALLRALAIAAGCGEDDGIGTRYPVTGNVTYNGKPVESGMITFTPDNPDAGRVATGNIRDGYYSLTTLAPDDGALPGSVQGRPWWPRAQMSP